MMKRAGLAIALVLVFAVLALAQVGPLPGMGPLPPGRPSISTPQSLGTVALAFQPTASTISLTLANSILSGDLVFVGFSNTTNNSVTMSSVADSCGNTYTKADTTGLIGTFTEVSAWYKANATACASGQTITGTYTGLSGANNEYAIGANRVTGVLATSPLDRVAHNSATGGAATVTATTAALSQTNEVAFGFSAAVNATSPTYSGASGFTNINQASDASFTLSALDYDTVAATTAVAFSPTYSAASFRIGAVVATFKGF